MEDRALQNVRKPPFDFAQGPYSDELRDFLRLCSGTLFGCAQVLVIRSPSEAEVITSTASGPYNPTIL